MDLEMRAISTFETSSSGLPVYRVQFLNADTGEVVSDVDIVTGADCVKYLNQNPLIKDALGFKKGSTMDTDIEKIVDAMLYPYYPPEFVTIYNTTSVDDFGDEIKEDKKVYKEKGVSIPKFILSTKLMAGSKKLVRCSLVRIQNNVRDVIENKALNVNPGEFVTLDFNMPGFTNDIQYFFEASDNENNVESIKLNYEFVLPVYVGYAKDGLLEPSLPNEDLNYYLNGLINKTDRVEKRLVELNTPQKAFFNIVADKDDLCPFIMVPLRWNSIIAIKDINGMDITKFFGHDNYVVLETHSGNTDQEGYVIYISRQPADSKAKTRYLRDITYIFAHDLDWKDQESEGEQTEVITGFDVLTPGPIDSRFVKESYDELAYIKKPYIGLIVYVKNINTYYKYTGNGVWEVTNNTTRFYKGKPSNTMGGKMDISIDIASGDIYQKNNSNLWELKGNIRTGVTK